MDLVNNSGNGGSPNDIDGLDDVRVQLCPGEQQPCLGDFNGDNKVAINELILAVSNALKGCSPPALVVGPFEGSGLRNDFDCPNPTDDGTVAYSAVAIDIAQDGPSFSATLNADDTFTASLHAGVNYRILYFFHRNVAAVVSHGLAKERAVPPVEIARAIERKRRFERSPDRHTYREEGHAE